MTGIPDAYLSFHGSLLLPSLDETFHNSITLIQKTIDDTRHLSLPIIFFHHRLVLVDDHGDALEQSRQGSDIIERGRGCTQEGRPEETESSFKNIRHRRVHSTILLAEAGALTRTRSTTNDAYA